MAIFDDKGGFTEDVSGYTAYFNVTDGDKTTRHAVPIQDASGFRLVEEHNGRKVERIGTTKWRDQKGIDVEIPDDRLSSFLYEKAKNGQVYHQVKRFETKNGDFEEVAMTDDVYERYPQLKKTDKNGQRIFRTREEWQNSGTVTNGIFFDTVREMFSKPEHWGAKTNEDGSADVVGTAREVGERFARGVAGGAASVATGTVGFLGDTAVDVAGLAMRGVGAVTGDESMEDKILSMRKGWEDARQGVRDFVVDKVMGETITQGNDAGRSLAMGGYRAGEEFGGLRYGLGSIAKLGGSVGAAIGATEKAATTGAMVATATTFGVSGFERTEEDPSIRAAGAKGDAVAVVNGVVNAAVGPVLGKLFGAIKTPVAERSMQKTFAKLAATAAIDSIEGGVVMGGMEAGNQFSRAAAGIKDKPVLDENGIPTGEFVEPKMSERLEAVMNAAVYGISITAGMKMAEMSPRMFYTSAPGKAVSYDCEMDRKNYAPKVVEIAEAARRQVSAMGAIVRDPVLGKQVKGVTTNGEVILSGGTVYYPPTEAGREARIVVSDGTILNAKGDVVGKLAGGQRLERTVDTVSEAYARATDPGATREFTMIDPATGSATSVDIDSVAPESFKKLQEWMRNGDTKDPPVLDAEGVQYARIRARLEQGGDAGHAAELALGDVASGRKTFKEAADLLDQVDRQVNGKGAAKTVSENSGDSSETKGAEVVRPTEGKIVVDPGSPKKSALNAGNENATNEIPRPAVEAAAELVVAGETGELKPGEVDVSRIDQSGLAGIEPGKGDGKATNPIVLWENPETGKLEVIDGRKRTASEVGSGAKTVKAVVLRAEDGWTRENAEAFGLVANLRDGSLGAGEMVNAFRKLGLDVGTATDMGLVGHDGSVEGRLADNQRRAALKIAMWGDEGLGVNITGDNLMKVAAIVDKINVRTWGDGWREVQRKMAQALDGADLATTTRSVEIARNLSKRIRTGRVDEWRVVAAAKYCESNGIESPRNELELRMLEARMASDKVSMTPVEKEDGTLETLTESEASTRSESDRINIEAPGEKVPGTSTVAEMKADRTNEGTVLSPVDGMAGVFGCERFPALRVSVDDQGNYSVTGVSAQDMADPRNQYDMAKILGDVWTRANQLEADSGKKVKIIVPEGTAGQVNALLDLYDTAIRRDPALVSKSDQVLDLLEKSGLAVGVITDENEFNAFMARSKNGHALVEGGLVQGFAVDGKVYLNPKYFGTKAGLNTRVHEFGHLGLIACERINKEVYDRGMALADTVTTADGRKLIDVLRKTDGYSGLSEKQLREEVLAKLIGNRGEEVIREIKDKSIQAKVREWVNDFWKKFGEALGLVDITAEQAKAMTIEEVVDSITTEMLSGRKFGQSFAKKLPKVSVKAYNQMRDNQSKLVDIAKNGGGFQDSNGRIMLNDATVDTTVPQTRALIEAGEKRGIFEKGTGEMVAKFIYSFRDYLRSEASKYKSYQEFADKHPVFAVDPRDGKLKSVSTIVRPDIEYPYTTGFSTLCVKTRPYQDVIARLADTGVLDRVVLNSQDAGKIRDILKAHGLEVSCGACYVESKRFQRGSSFAYNFARDFNELVDMQKNDAKQFSELLRTALEKEAGKKSLTIEDSAVLLLDRYPQERKHVKTSDFMGSKNPDRTMAERPLLFKVWKKTGAGRPKDVHQDQPYQGEVAKPIDTIMEGRTRGFLKRWVNRGSGLRSNSFDDYVDVLVLDYVQQFADMAAKRLYGHDYTKVLTYVDLFNETGMKINMSGWPKSVKGGIAPGLDADGNLVWADESVGADVTRKIDGMTGMKMALERRNNTVGGRRGDVGVIGVAASWKHLGKLLDSIGSLVDTVIPFHSSGADEHTMRAAGQYGWQDFQGLQETRFGRGWSFVREDGTTEAISEGKGLKFPTGVKYAMYRGKKYTAKELAFDYNEECKKVAKEARKDKDEARYNQSHIEAAENYRKFCKEHGLLGKFQVEGHEAECWDHPNYFAVLADYRLVDANGNYSPAREIEFKFPKNFNEIALEGIKRYQAKQDKISKEMQPIVDEVLRDVLNKERIDSDPNPTLQLNVPTLDRSMFVFGKARVAEDAGMGELTPGGIAASYELAHQGATPISAAGRIRQMSLPISELEWLRKRLTGNNLPAQVAKRIPGGANSASTKTGKLVIAADVFGSVDKTDMEDQKTLLKSHGFFRNEDSSWVLGKAPAVIRAEKQRSEDQLANQLLNLADRRSKGQAGGETAARGIFADELAKIIMEMPAAPGVAGKVQTIGKAVQEEITDRIRAVGGSSADAEAVMRQQAGDFLDWAYGQQTDAAGNPVNRRDTMSLKDLTSEAFGAFLVMPSELGARAQRWHDAIVDIIATNPKLADAFRDVSQRGMSEQASAYLTDQINRSFSRQTQEVIRKMQLEGNEPIKPDNKGYRLLEPIVVGFHDKMGPIAIRINDRIKTYKAAQKAAIKAAATPAEKALIKQQTDLFLGQMGRLSKQMELSRLAVERGGWNEGRRYFVKMLMLENEASERWGLSEEDRSLFLDLKRTIETQGRAASFGMSPRQAQIELEAMQTRLGSAAYAKLEEYGRKFFAIHEMEVLNDPRMELAFGKEFVDYCRSQQSYVSTKRTWSTEELNDIEAMRQRMRRLGVNNGDDVISQMFTYAGASGAGDTTGESGWTARLVGSFAAKQEVRSATWEKMDRLMQFVRRNKYIVDMRDALLAAGVKGVSDHKRTDVPFPENARYGRINYLANGEKRTLVVPRQIADGFRRDIDTMPFITKANGVARSLYIDYNVAYWNRNVNRNLGSIEKNMPGMRETWLKTVLRAVLPGAANVSDVALNHAMRHLDEKSTAAKTIKAMFGDNAPIFYVQKATRMAKLLDDPSSWQKELWAAQDSGDIQKFNEMQQDLAETLEMLKANMFVGVRKAYSSEQTEGFANDIMNSKGFKMLTQVQQQAQKSKAAKVIELLKWPFKANQEQQNYEDVLAKTIAYLHDRSKFALERSVQETGATVAGNVSIAQGERSGRAKGMVQKLINPFFNMIEKGVTRHQNNLLFNKGQRAETWAKDSKVWFGRFVGQAIGAGLVSAFIKWMNDGDEEKSRNGSLGLLYRYGEFWRNSAKNLSDYVRKNYMTIPIWTSPSGYTTVVIGLPLNDEDKVVVPTADLAVDMMANKFIGGAKPDVAGAVAQSTYASVVPDFQAASPAAVILRDTVEALRHNPIDLYRGTKLYDQALYDQRGESVEMAGKFAASVGMRLWNDLGGRAFIEPAREGMDDGQGEAPRWLHNMLTKIPVVSPVLKSMIKIQVGSPERDGKVVTEEVKRRSDLVKVLSKDLVNRALKDGAPLYDVSSEEWEKQMSTWRERYALSDVEMERIEANLINAWSAKEGAEDAREEKVDKLLDKASDLGLDKADFWLLRGQH